MLRRLIGESRGCENSLSFLLSAAECQLAMRRTNEDLVAMRIIWAFGRECNSMAAMCNGTLTPAEVQRICVEYAEAAILQYRLTMNLMQARPARRD